MADVVPFPFATVDELKERWPDFPAGAEQHAGTLLEDASQFILDVCPSASDVAETTRRRVVCSVVRRSMQSDQNDMGGMSNMSMTSGPFSVQQTSANPNGDFFLTKQEKFALGGGGRQKAFGVQVASTTGVHHRPWCSLMFGAAYCSCGADLTLEGPLWEA